MRLLKWTALGALIGAVLGCGGCLTLSYRDVGHATNDMRVFPIAGSIIFGAIGAVLGLAAGAILAAARSGEEDDKSQPSRTP
jgi:hypothetical protein